MNVPVWNPSDFDPAFLTFREYLEIVDAREKSHPSDAYRTSIESMSSYLRYEDHPELIKQVTIRGLKFEFRLRRRKCDYSRRDEFGELVRDVTNGSVVMLSDEEIAAKGLRPEEWSVVAFDEDRAPVAAYLDEWGCVLIMVADEYRGANFGLGYIMSRIAGKMDPTKPTGGFTPSGYQMYRKMHREMVRDALKAGKYRDWVKAGEMTPERAKEIIGSVDLARRIKPVAGVSLNTKNPRDWMFFIENGFVCVYDRKLKDILEEGMITDWTKLERFIIGSLYVAIGETYGRIKMIGGETPKIKALMMRFAIQFAVTEGVALVVEPEDIGLLPPGTQHSEEDNTAGYTSVLVDKMTMSPIDFALFQQAEEAFRASFDRYDEFKNYMMELGDAKYRLNR